MTSREPEEGGRHNVLIADYGGTSFLIRRDQCQGSVYLERSLPRAHPRRFLDSLMEYRGEKLLVFDLDAWLRSTFSLPREQDLHAALISPVTRFTKETQDALGRLAGAQSGEASDSMVAFKVTSRMEMARISADSVKPLPRGLRPGLEFHGVLGCRFASQTVIHYYLDIETVLFRTLVDQGMGE